MVTVGDGALGALVRQIEKRADAGEDVSIGTVQRIAGQRAAGPILLLPALLVVSPLSIIPGLPTMVGLNTIVVAGQVVLGREHIWLPKWLTRRCITAKRARTFLKFLGPVSRAADGVVKDRARPLTGRAMRRAGAAICVLVGALMPAMELVPFTSTGGGAIIAVYALAITARDGLLAVAWFGLLLGAVSLALALLT